MTSLLTPLATIAGGLVTPSAVVTAAALDKADPGTDPYVIHVTKPLRKWRATLWYVGYVRPQRLASVSCADRDDAIATARNVAVETNAACGQGLPLDVRVTP